MSTMTKKAKTRTRKAKSYQFREWASERYDLYGYRRLRRRVPGELAIIYRERY